MFGISAQITRWVDDDQPGIVECRFRDAHGNLHTFIEKLPVVCAADLSAASAYPQQGVIDCEVLDQRRDFDGRVIVRVSTERPWGIEATDGNTVFEVLSEALIELEGHLPAAYLQDDDSELPSEHQREQLGELIHYAFLEIRILGWDGKAQQAADLADTFHNLPREMYGWGTWSWTRLRNWLGGYQKKHEGNRRGLDYVARLDAIR